jgi:hypothetical protein
MRISEVIALEWNGINCIHGTTRVSKVLTQASRVYELPKTQHSMPDVELHGPALVALKKMKQFTSLNGGIIFRNPFDGLHWNGDSPVRKKWKGLLKKAGAVIAQPNSLDTPAHRHH